MDYSLEPKIWSQAHRAFSQQAFEVLVDVAVSSYLRNPGHTGVERMHASQIGPCGLHALRTALIGQDCCDLRRWLSVTYR
jgi:hypothetical protein